MTHADATSSALLARGGTPASQRAVAGWLIVCCALIFAMVVVGGITRLTHSGLSIVEWQPIVGAVPPLDEAQWRETFEKYQRTPEYEKINKGMTLAEFKGIFWWEYAHRLLGRLIGAVFLAPLVWFALRGRIERALLPRLVVIFVLGGLQGALGWYMVQSGLVDDPRVSQLRLAAHLGLAAAIYAAILWTALDLLYPQGSVRATVSPRSLRVFSLILTATVFVMMLSGALVAGIHAGLAYNTFPLMNGQLLPPEAFLLEPRYRNFFSNMATVQFDHRLIAWVLVFAIPTFWLRARRASLTARARWCAHLLLAALVVQIALGIATLLLVVPVPLAAAHQAGALALFTASLLVSHSLR
jgi:cytochrome c oxidase assembly protein subunit 15